MCKRIITETIFMQHYSKCKIDDPSSTTLHRYLWTVANAFFKAECGIINIGLGAGTAWEIFNRGILYFGLI